MASRERLRVEVSALLVLAQLAGGCAALRLDETGAAGHRAEAARERALAREHEEQFDPEAVVPPQPLQREDPGTPVMNDSVVGSNPTVWHLDEANRHTAHAHAHTRAAEALERLEAAECAGVAARERSACPLLPGVNAVIETPRGVRLELASAAQRARVLARMRCHLAYARSIGFASASPCPLYVRGVDILAATDDRTIELVGEDRAAVSSIRRALAAIAVRAR